MCLLAAVYRLLKVQRYLTPAGGTLSYNHSRAGGNPAMYRTILDPRLRGGDMAGLILSKAPRVMRNTTALPGSYDWLQGPISFVATPISQVQVDCDATNLLK